MPFIDVEAALVSYLENIAYTCTFLDDIFGEEGNLLQPSIVINRVGGGADQLGVYEDARIQIDCISFTRAGSYSLNQQVRQALVGAAAVQTPSGLIDLILEDIAAIQVPYGLEQVDIIRASSSWIVSSRTQ